MALDHLFFSRGLFFIGLAAAVCTIAFATPFMGLGGQHHFAAFGGQVQSFFSLNHRHVDGLILRIAAADLIFTQDLGDSAQTEVGHHVDRFVVLFPQSFG